MPQYYHQNCRHKFLNANLPPIISPFIDKPLKQVPALKNMSPGAYFRDFTVTFIIKTRHVIKVQIDQSFARACAGETR